jgi:anti-sigma28 factor (negative regulator of flagellin synthesis)
MMLSVRSTAAVVCALFLSACTTEPYQESISTFAKGVVASQSALNRLDDRQTEIRRRIQIRSQITKLQVGDCKIGFGCEFKNLAPPKSSVPTALLYMAQLVAYADGLVELAAAKDTAALQKAVDRIDSAARASIKSFAPQVRNSATIIASLDLIGLAANEFINEQRVEALRQAIVRNQYRVERAIAELSSTSYQLQSQVLLAEHAYLQEQTAAFNASKDPAEQARLSNEISAQQNSLNELAKADARVPFKALLKAHRAVVKAAKNPNYSLADAAGLLLDFLEKAQALDAAVKKGD